MTRRYEIIENARGFVHEDRLPDDLADEDYHEWFKLSSVPGNVGCRVGPPVRRLETIANGCFNCKKLKPDGSIDSADIGICRSCNGKQWELNSNIPPITHYSELIHDCDKCFWDLTIGGCKRYCVMSFNSFLSAEAMRNAIIRRTKEKTEMNIDDTMEVISENRIMKKALKRISKWFGEIPKVKDSDGEMRSYSFCYGSNGERDYMRNVAKEALDQVE